MPHSLEPAVVTDPPAVSHIPRRLLEALTHDEPLYTFDVVDVVRASVAAIVGRYRSEDLVVVRSGNDESMGYRLSEDRTLLDLVANPEPVPLAHAPAVMVFEGAEPPSREAHGDLPWVGITVDAEGATLRWGGWAGTARGKLTRMALHHARLLEAIAHFPRRPVTSVDVLVPQERAEVLARSRGVVKPYNRDGAIHDVFVRVAAARPDAIAVRDDATTLTYAQLDARSNQLARYLHDHGVAPGSTVGVALDRSVTVPVALLAILKAGAAYVPLDCGDTADRLTLMIGDARVAIVVTSGAGRDWISLGARSVIDLAEAASEIDARRAEAYRVAMPLEPRAYILYTSGSTGRPKGVEVGHRAVLRLVCGTDFAALDEHDVVLQLAPLSFDASTFELWAPLLNGACLAMAPAGNLALGEIAGVLERFGVTTLWLTAPLFRLMVERELPRLAGLRRLLSGGDVVSPEHARRFLRAHPACELINGYGPTENTTFSCTYRVPSADAVGESLPIGRPIANSTAYVLDRQRGLAPLGAIGELYVGGDGVARGYCNLPELTAERFLRDPFSVYPEARMYRTGDLVRWRDDGQLDYLGRIDRQVKVRGFRVELEEIEAALGSHPAVLDAAVTVVTSGEEKTLHAFVSLVPGGRADRETIRGHLIATLPAYMRPHRIAVLDTLPLLSSGKVDRVALAALAETQLEAPAVRRGTPPTREVTVEARIRRMWQSVVRTPDALEVDENFFDAGGDSLMLMKLHASMQHEFGIELSIVDLFNETTIRKQARLIEALLTT